MNEEAGFIAALLAEPDDRTALLVYADWLQEREDPRAEYLRQLAARRPNQRRVKQLRRTCDPVWAVTVTERIGCGSTVRVTAGAFRNSTGAVGAVMLSDTGEAVVVVRVIFFERPLDIHLAPSSVERITTPAA